MRIVNLSGLKQGIQRIREKGSADPDTLYDLDNGYVTIDGGIKQRPGTALAYTLPAGTLGMCAHDGDLVVFSTSPKATPAGVRCEVITHPFFPSQGITYIWYAAPFLGYLYVVAEFENGDIYHDWLQASSRWEASTMYREGQIIVPGTPNGLGYKAHRVLPKYPTWTPGMDVDVGKRVEPSEANGYYYEAITTSEADGVGTPGGSPNPDGGSTPTPGKDGGTGGGGATVAAGQSGAIPGGYVGVPYSNVGAYGDPWADTGAGGYRYVTADLWPGGTISHNGLQSAGVWLNDIAGIPLVAGSYDVQIAVDVEGNPASFFHAVTIAAKPSYAVLDFSRRGDGDVRHTGLAPAFTGVELAGDGILDCAGWTSGKVYFEVDITAADSLLLGVHAAGLDNLYAGPGRAGTSGYAVAAIDTYGVAFDTATGNLWVRNTAGWIGGGDPATGTTPTVAGGPTTSTNGRFRAALYGTATAQANFGNEAWAYSAPAGFAGIAMPSVQVPAVWAALPIGSKYTLSAVGGIPSRLFAGSIIAGLDGMALATVGKSSGKWQVELTNPRIADDERVGLCVAAFDRADGLLGAAGTENSIGVRNAVLQHDFVKIETCFGGVHAEYLHAVNVGVDGRPEVFTFAADLTAGTVAIYADGVLLRTLAGVPAGTYYPAVTSGYGGASQITATNLAHPVATFADWTETV